ncbi:hypothetical protein QKQ25_gp053 [Hyphantria cunea granulovirus]|uniref:Uncharacterized protein n=1 Tax=Hyphantria cunea granulovirus TaxID=307448 RepID=A0AAE6D0C0_9BBAC|nr:hypothetical protein QKQ25_gp053 [Hyphantria cunea granulovirus]QBQ01606.1 hypothetical protein HycuGV_00053 [Hyphantria cunea granulovirus]
MCYNYGPSIKNSEPKIRKFHKNVRFNISLFILKNFEMIMLRLIKKCGSLKTENS